MAGGGLLRRPGATGGAQDDDEEVDPFRPCRFIQFASCSDKLLVRQQRNGKVSAALGGVSGAAAPACATAAALRSGDEGVVVREARPLGSGDFIEKHYDGTSSSSGGSGSSGSLYDSDDEYDSTSSGTTDYCGSSSVASDLTTDPRLLALAKTSRDRVDPAPAVDDDSDRAAPPQRDNEAAELLPDYRPPARNPPDWVFLALVALSIVVLVIDVAWSAVADLAARWWIVARPPPPNPAEPRRSGDPPRNRDEAGRAA
jgi:hypothetical protein